MNIIVRLFRLSLFCIVVLLCGTEAIGQSGRIVVADSITRQAISGVAVFDRNSRFLGTSRNDGSVNCVSFYDFPIVVRYLGYADKTIETPGADTIFIKECIAELPEFVVAESRQRVLHILAYVREYSTLAGYNDTVTMYREKMVDFMLPGDRKIRFTGWRTPRVLNVNSYYHFKNSQGLDSVSDRCGHHFSWSDWIGILPKVEVPASLASISQGRDTLQGKYRPTEIWAKSNNKLTIDVDVLADTASRKWVPNLSQFFRNDNIDFEECRLRLNYDNVMGYYAGAVDLNAFSFNIDSRGRGYNMFRFNRYDEPFFVTTYTEVYIVDKAFITVKEARQWEKHAFKEADFSAMQSDIAPPLQASTVALIDRVNNINSDELRVSVVPDHRLVGRNLNAQNFSIGHRALNMFKNLLGISSYKANKKAQDYWREFRSQRTHRDPY